jgi:hypothetical protein
MPVPNGGDRPRRATIDDSSWQRFPSKQRSYRTITETTSDSVTRFWDIPVFIGKSGKSDHAARAYMGKTRVRFRALWVWTPIRVGVMIVTPYLCDHSAFVAYLFHIAVTKDRVTRGDFDLRPKEFPFTPGEAAPGRCTHHWRQTTHRTPDRPVTEEALKNMPYRFCRCGGTSSRFDGRDNIDRLVRCKRRHCGKEILLQRLYLAAFPTAAGEINPGARDFLMSGISTTGADERYKQLNLWQRVNRESSNRQSGRGSWCVCDLRCVLIWKISLS